MGVQVEERCMHAHKWVSTDTHKDYLFYLNPPGLLKLKLKKYIYWYLMFYTWRKSGVHFQILTQITLFVFADSQEIVNRLSKYLTGASNVYMFPIAEVMVMCKGKWWVTHCSNLLIWVLVIPSMDHQDFKNITMHGMEWGKH